MILGLFPDIGASYFLPRLQGKLGYLISLTGTKLTGRDVWHTGIATHYCDSVKISNLEYSLLHLNSGNDVDSVINDFCPKSQSQFSLTKNLDQINECFDAASVDEIICKLKNYNSEWATKTIQVFENLLRLSQHSCVKCYLLLKFNDKSFRSLFE